MEETVIGDFKRLDKYSNEDCTKWLYSKESVIISHWHMNRCSNMLHCLYDVEFKENSFTYTDEISISKEVHNHFKEHDDDIVGREGIILLFKNTSLDNIKLDNGCSMDRFMKQVMDIVKS